MGKLANSSAVIRHLLRTTVVIIQPAFQFISYIIHILHLQQLPLPVLDRAEKFSLALGHYSIVIYHLQQLILTSAYTHNTRHFSLHQII